MRASRKAYGSNSFFKAVLKLKRIKLSTDINIVVAVDSVASNQKLSYISWLELVTVKNSSSLTPAVVSV